MAEITADQVKTELTEHKLDYERRHGDLSGRVIRLEAAFLTLATKEDLQNVKAAIVRELSETIATRTDVDWLKKAFWFGMGILSSLITILGGLLIYHLAGK